MDAWTILMLLIGSWVVGQFMGKTVVQIMEKKPVHPIGVICLIGFVLQIFHVTGLLF